MAIKMISAQHSSSNGKKLAKIKLPKNPVSMVIFCKQLRRPETVEVGCPRHPEATTIGNQLQDGDRTDGWPNLTTQP